MNRAVEEKDQLSSAGKPGVPGEQDCGGEDQPP